MYKFWRFLNKLVEKKDSFLDRIIKFLQFAPLLLILWALWQTMMLSNYNALVLFSWTQVFNDTVIIFIPFLMGGIWYYLWLIDCWYYPSIKWHVWRLVSIVVSIILCILVCAYIFPKNNLWLLLLSWFMSLLWSFYSIFIPWNSKINIIKNNAIRNWLRPVILIPIILLLLPTLHNFFPRIYLFFYNNLEIQTNTGNEKIRYMNDKYIIYGSWKILPVIPETQGKLIISDE